MMPKLASIFIKVLDQQACQEFINIISYYMLLLPYTIIRSVCTIVCSSLRIYHGSSVSVANVQVVGKYPISIIVRTSIIAVLCTICKVYQGYDVPGTCKLQ